MVEKTRDQEPFAWTNQATTRRALLSRALLWARCPLWRPASRHRRHTDCRAAGSISRSDSTCGNSAGGGSLRGDERPVPTAIPKPAAAAATTAPAAAAATRPPRSRTHFRRSQDQRQLQVVQSRDFHPDHNALIEAKIKEFAAKQNYPLDHSYIEAYAGWATWSRN